MIIGANVDDKIPESDPFYSLYQSDQYKIHFPVEQREDNNTPDYLDNIVKTIYENLKDSEIRPSIAFHNAPKNFLLEEDLEWKMVDEGEDSFED